MIDLIIIIFLSLGNGFFSAAEIALITLKQSRLKNLKEDKKNKRAEILYNLKKEPNQLFATVQIGVTLIGTITSVFGGSSFVGKLSELIKETIQIEIIKLFSEEISFASVVILITYLQIIIGELVPKSLALHHSERIAFLVAYPLYFFSNIFSFLSKILIFSSNLFLKPFKDKTSFSEAKLITEDILHILEEGVKDGTIEKSEHEMIENILEFNDTDAREVMIPRVDMVSISIDAEEEEIQRVLQSMYTRIPVYKDNLDNIVGILHIKDLIRSILKKENLSISKIIRPPFFVPESMKIGKILREMQKRKNHIAIVVDEYGGTAGLLTLEDILEEIVGEIQDMTENQNNQNILQLKENVYLVSGSCNVFDFNEFLQEDVIPESEVYTTVAGFIIELLGRFPEVDEKIKFNDFIFTLIKKSKQKMIQFKVERNNKQELKFSSK
ncbi:MAG: hemolysin family protein [Leptonema sp. (in: bacteria)]